MSTDRLYYADSYLIEFDAVVRDVAPADDRWIVTIDRSAFYPTSGGQPFDTGTLGEAKVLDVFDQENGTIGHAVDRELDKAARVRGHVDWPRRFDHMQQHTGQHLLSAAFDRELGAKTVSFHLGASSCTIDLDKDLSVDQVAAIEASANQVVWTDREVCARIVAASEAARLPLRKETIRTGDIRVVEIADYDMSACGGTHVSRTGAIGMIGIAGTERFKGGTRVEFVCGGRALRAYREMRDTVNNSVRLLSVLPSDLPSAIEKLQSVNKSRQKAHDALSERLVVHEAAALRSNGRALERAVLVAESIAGSDVGGLKRLASAIVSRPETIAALLTDEPPFSVVVARSDDLPMDAGAVLKRLLDRFGGKGGGRGSMAQGGGLTGDPAEILTAATEAFQSS